MNHNTKIKFLVPIWFISVLMMFTCMWWYKTRPGAAGAELAHWPTSSRIRLGAEPFTLLMFAHPGCKCSDASVHELTELLREISVKPKVIVVLYHPRGTPESWADTALRNKLKSTNAISVLYDEGGETAFHFGARTSGQTYLYDSSGNLRFSGGITETRGHIGESAGRRSIASIVGGKKPETSNTRAFGCALFSQRELSLLIKTQNLEVSNGHDRIPANQD